MQNIPQPPKEYKAGDKELFFILHLIRLWRYVPEENLVRLAQKYNIPQQEIAGALGMRLDSFSRRYSKKETK